MNIYLVSRKENNWDYDTFIEFVCYAGSPGEAIRLKPWEHHNLNENSRLYYERSGEYQWPTDISELEVEYLGELPFDNFQANVISSSFRNG